VRRVVRAVHVRQLDPARRRVRLHCLYDIEGSGASREDYDASDPATTAWELGGMARGYDLAGFQVPRVLKRVDDVEVALGEAEDGAALVPAAAGRLQVLGLRFGTEVLCLSLEVEATPEEEAAVRRQLWLRAEEVGVGWSFDVRTDLLGAVAEMGVPVDRLYDVAMVSVTEARPGVAPAELAFSLLNRDPGGTMQSPPRQPPAANVGGRLCALQGTSSALAGQEPWYESCVVLTTAHAAAARTVLRGTQRSAYRVVAQIGENADLLPPGEARGGLEALLRTVTEQQLSLTFAVEAFLAQELTLPSPRLNAFHRALLEETQMEQALAATRSVLDRQQQALDAQRSQIEARERRLQDARQRVVDGTAVGFAALAVALTTWFGFFSSSATPIDATAEPFLSDRYLTFYVLLLVLVLVLVCVPLVALRRARAETPAPPVAPTASQVAQSGFPT
jgi:hypothetical protein